MLLAVVGSLSCLSGCSDGGAGAAKVKTVPFSGKILLDGTPHGNVTVTFTPQGSEGGERTAYSQVKEDGSFAATTYVTGDGIVPGKYDVRVGAEADAGSIDPSKMMAAVVGASIEKLEVDIPADGLTDVELKMISGTKSESVGSQSGIGLGK